MAKPTVIALLPLYAPLAAALERDYAVLKAWEAPNPLTYMRDAGAQARVAT